MRPAGGKNQPAVVAPRRLATGPGPWHGPRPHRTTPVPILPLPDLLALLFFLVVWIGYATLVARAQTTRSGLMAIMHEARSEWMQQMERRDVRIVDTAIMSSLQNGTAFFASTSLIAIGGAAALLRSTDDVLRLSSELPLGPQVSRGLWELKAIGLAIIFGYAFFKFSWAYRLFNYSAILIGATPPASSPDKTARRAAAERAARMTIVAGSNFAAGQRAFFFSFAYLGWFLGPYTFIASTILIAGVVWHRQFRSRAVLALGERGEPERGTEKR